MTDLRTTLQSSLGAAYTIERELGGGGMSRVFLATENQLSRLDLINNKRSTSRPQDLADAAALEALSE